MQQTLGYGPSDYPFARGSGVDKLIDSGIAPLVAFARGTRSLGPDDVKPIQARHGWSGRSRQGMQVKRAVGDTDALYLPWYQADHVVEMERGGYDMVSHAPQLRPNPANLIPDAKGKVAKYQNMAGSPLEMGPHPATPASWLTSATRQAMFTEGLLKVDSAVTAMLLANGTTPHELRLADTDTDVVAARTRLRQLLERIPEARRVVIYGFVSVTTFGKNPEWNAFRAAGDCYVAFDGDLASNPMVWRGGQQLFELLERKGGQPKLIDLSYQALPDGSKVGMDDFLSKLGGWDDLLGLATDNLPPRPEGADTAAPGTWRMNGDKLVAESYRPPVDESDPGSWVTRHEFVARVATVEDRRSATRTELATGVYEQRVDARDMDSRVEIEVEWFDNNQTRHKGVVTGPADLMGSLPHEWRRITGTAIPASVQALHTWPPREPDFMVATKRYREDERTIRPLWDHMGWVPTQDGSPVFLVGQQVIGAHGFQPEAAASAVTSREVKTADQFGVQLPDDDDDARDALRQVLDAYLPTNPEKAPFRNPKHASIFIAAALRPTVPLECRVPLALTGASGAGKSWASAATMMFWQSEPGTWDERNLPGSASDTPASTEVSMSKTPIWVVDDLAPSEEDPTHTGRQAQAVWGFVRNVHNGSSRARRKSDMTAQDTNRPRALLIVSAERAPEKDQSIMNRMVHVVVRKRKFLSASQDPTDHVVWLGSDGGSPQSKVTGYIIRMLAKRGAHEGWSTLVDNLLAERQAHTEAASMVMAGASDGKRQAKTVADLALGLVVLWWMVSDLGMDDEYGQRIANMLDDLYRVAKDGYESANHFVVGKAFMRDLAAALSAHRCHVSALGLPGPPVTNGPDGFHAQADAINDLLGWTPAGDDDTSRAGGPRVGFLLTDNNGNLAVLFDTQSSFAAVGGYRSHDPNSVWESAVQHGWRLELDQGGWKVKPSGGGAGLKQRITRDGNLYEGVAVPLWKLLGYDQDHPNTTQQ